MIRRIVKKVFWEKNRYIKFILPNIKQLISKNILCNVRTLAIYQSVFFYKYGGKYKIGEGVQFGYDIGGKYRKGYCELQARYKNSYIEIGDKTAINNNLLIMSADKVIIGPECRIGVNCQIMDFDGHGIDPKERSNRGNISPVYIGKNVWIGNNVTILPGSKIGENSIIAAGAIVKGNIPDNVVAGGIPARVIKEI